MTRCVYFFTVHWFKWNIFFVIFSCTDTKAACFAFELGFCLNLKFYEKFLQAIIMNLIFTDVSRFYLQKKSFFSKLLRMQNKGKLKIKFDSQIIIILISLLMLIIKKYRWYCNSERKLKKNLKRKEKSRNISDVRWNDLKIRQENCNYSFSRI